MHDANAEPNCTTGSNVWCVLFATCRCGHLSETVLQLAQETAQSFDEDLDMASDRSVLTAQQQVYDCLPLGKACMQLQMSVLPQEMLILQASGHPTSSGVMIQYSDIYIMYNV